MESRLQCSPYINPSAFIYFPVSVPFTVHFQAGHQQSCTKQPLIWEGIDADGSPVPICQTFIFHGNEIDVLMTGGVVFPGV